jgi:hypothetical protein
MYTWISSGTAQACPQAAASSSAAAADRIPETAKVLLEFFMLVDDVGLLN